MAKFECDIDNVDEVFEKLGDLASKCPIKTFEMASAMVASGSAKNPNQAAKQLADQLGEPEETIKSRIKRGKKAKVGSGEPTFGTGGKKKSPKPSSKRVYKVQCKYMKMINEVMDNENIQRIAKLNLLADLRDFIYDLDAFVEHHAREVEPEVDKVE